MIVVRLPCRVVLRSMTTSGETTDEKMVERGCVQFTRERVEKVRGGRRVTSVSRDRTKRLRVKNEAASQHPLRETLWACGFCVASALSALSAYQSSERASWIAAGVLAVLAGLCFRHLGSKIAVVELRGDDGGVRIEIEERLSEAEVDGLNQYLAEELGWPVR